MSRRKVETGKAVLVGLVAGMAGAAAMSAFSAMWEKLLPASAGHPEPYVESSNEARDAAPPMHASQQEWDATLNTAVAVMQAVIARPLSARQQERAAVAVHYAIGGVIGALYAIGREYVPELGTGAGALFGAAVFVAAQEIGTPLVGISKPLREYTPAMHANSLGEHVAWGVTTEFTRRALRRVL